MKREKPNSFLCQVLIRHTGVKTNVNFRNIDDIHKVHKDNNRRYVEICCSELGYAVSHIRNA